MTIVAEKKATDFQEQIYRQALRHYKDCQYRQGKTSDTWLSAFDRKGRSYSIDEMKQMFAPGSKVTTLIVDWDYLVDSKVFDLKDDILRGLLEMKESDFGYPRKDVAVNGQYFSSHFLRNAQTAARIIRLIEDSGIKKPQVMEIGGGTGVLQFLLKKYFGERITLFAVDLPETLLIQEWYLRNCFPDVGFAYKESDERRDFVYGGVNFINAFTLESQSVNIDVAINIASMQEMEANVANSYIKYIEKNMNEGGIFFFENGYGHSTGSVLQPSEYNFDPYWEIKSASIAYPIEMTTGIEHLLLIFLRTKKACNSKTRTYLLRFLWNGLLTGLLTRNTKLIEGLIFSSQTLPFDKFLSHLKNIVEEYELPLTSQEISGLSSDSNFPYSVYAKISRFYNETNCAKEDLIDCAMKSFWQIQSKLIELMLDLQNKAKPNSLSTVKSEIGQICKRLSERGNSSFLNSEYATAYACSILFALGQFTQAVGLAIRCADISKNNFWQVRFAYLLSRFGFRQEACRIINSLWNDRITDLFLNLKKIEILYKCGDVRRVNKFIDIIAAKDDLSEVASQVLAKTAARVGRLDIVETVCLSLADSGREKYFHSLVDTFSFLLSEQKGSSALELIFKFKHFFTSFLNVPENKLEYGCLLSRLGEPDEARLLIIESLKAFKENYFKLAWAGKCLGQAGFFELSEDCLERSVKLRPPNFKHFKFIANVYFSGARVQNALVYYRKASALNPYIRSIKYKEAYCGLPQEVRQSNVFGRASDIELICQEEQDFYYDIGPHTR